MTSFANKVEMIASGKLNYCHLYSRHNVIHVSVCWWSKTLPRSMYININHALNRDDGYLPQDYLHLVGK